MQLRSIPLALIVSSYAAGASAHGLAPAATAILAEDEEGVSLVRLSQGLAQRTRDGFRFICPEAWGNDVGAPSAALAGGPALIGGETLFLVEAEGRLVPHPDGLGPAIALTNNRAGLFGLFQRGSEVELRRVDRAASELVRRFDEPFSGLAARESAVDLLRFSQRTLTLQSVSLDGVLQERVSWEAPSNVADAKLRAEVDQRFVLIWGHAAPWVSLGSLTERGFELLHEARTAIAGPLLAAATSVYVRDGTLAQLTTDSPLSAREHHVTCVERHGDLEYACVDGGLRRVDEHGLGPWLFQLSSLRQPDYELLPRGARAGCQLRWQDLELHLAEAEVALPDDVSDAVVPADAGVDANTDAPAPTSAPACALGGARPASSRLGWLLLTLIGVRAAGRRKRA